MYPEGQVSPSCRALHRSSWGSASPVSHQPHPGLTVHSAARATLFEPHLLVLAYSEPFCTIVFLSTHLLMGT